MDKDDRDDVLSISSAEGSPLGGGNGGGFGERLARIGADEAFSNFRRPAEGCYKRGEVKG